MYLSKLVILGLDHSCLGGDYLWHLPHARCPRHWHLGDMCLAHVCRPNTSQCFYRNCKVLVQRLLSVLRFYRATLCYDPLCVCLFVRSSVKIGVLSKRLNRSIWILAQRLHSAYSTSCFTEILISSEIRVLLIVGPKCSLAASPAALW